MLPKMSEFWTMPQPEDPILYTGDAGCIDPRLLTASPSAFVPATLAQVCLRARQLLRFGANSTLPDHLSLIRQSDIELARKIEPDCDETKTMTHRGEENWPMEWESDWKRFVMFLNWFRIQAHKSVRPEQ